MRPDLTEVRIKLLKNSISGHSMWVMKIFVKEI